MCYTYHYYIKQNLENYQGLLFKKIYQFMIVKQFRKKPAQEHIWNNPIKILQNLNVTNLCLHTCDLNSLIGKPNGGKGCLNSHSSF